MSNSGMQSVLGAIGVLMVSAPIVVAQPAGYMDAQSLAARLESLAQSSPRATLSSLGNSLGGNPIFLLTLSSDPATADSHPAMLISAGIDGRYLASTEISARIAEHVIENQSELLDEYTVYIVPQLNPDGASLNMKSMSAGFSGNIRLVDEDRDRSIDEDPPEDLNGDGMITMMRRLDPPLKDTPTHLADPQDPRLNIEPDTKEGQRATFTLYPEGLDNDGDGQINEDGLGRVDLNKNFMHRWPEHDPHAGRYPLSEPESLAVAQFVIEHQNIVAAVTIGRDDNLINQPDSKSKDITKRAPKAIDSSDAGLYKQVGEWYKESLGFKTASKSDTAGSFASWLYAQRGIPSFAVQPWARPDEKDASPAPDSADTPEQGGNEQEDLTPSPIGDISQETLDELAEAYVEMTGEEVDETMMTSITPEMIEQFAAQAGIEVRRVNTAEPEPAPSGDKKTEKNKSKKLSEDGKWLAYFEEAGIDGFVDWTPFDHPTLGPVEIGGFVPLSRVNPPADQLDPLGDSFTEFIDRLIEARPQVDVLGPEIEPLGEGLYEIRLAIINDGEMPTATAYATASRTVRPTVVRLSVPVEDIVNGTRISRIRSLAGNGGRSDFHWIVRSDDIASEHIEVVDPKFGSRSISLGTADEEGKVNP